MEMTDSHIDKETIMEDDYPFTVVVFLPRNNRQERPAKTLTDAHTMAERFIDGGIWIIRSTGYHELIPPRDILLVRITPTIVPLPRQ